MAETVNMIKNNRVESTGAVLSVKEYINNDYYLLFDAVSTQNILGSIQTQRKISFCNTKSLRAETSQALEQPVVRKVALRTLKEVY